MKIIEKLRKWRRNWRIDNGYQRMASENLIALGIGFKGFYEQRNKLLENLQNFSQSKNQDERFAHSLTCEFALDKMRSSYNWLIERNLPNQYDLPIKSFKQELFSVEETMQVAGIDQEHIFPSVRDAERVLIDFRLANKDYI